MNFRKSYAIIVHEMISKAGHLKLGISSELKLADLRRTAWTEMANKGATVPELAASAGWSMDTAAKNMDTYVVTSGPLADAGHGRREKNIKGTEK